MILVRLAAASLAVSLGLGAAQAADPERTGSIGISATVGTVGAGTTASVTLPEQSVTAPLPPPRALPPLKPLPKWDPHVCIGC